MRLSVPLSIGVAMLLAAACGGKPKPVITPQPNADSLEAARRRAMEDSLARERARRDSLARAEAERLRRQREADSLAALNARSRDAEAVRATLTSMINFDFDRSDIRAGDAQTLDQKTAALQANGAVRLMITGHADERGSDEYNLALGNRRALAAKKYLTDRGVDGSRLTTQSMGEEQPLNPGHTEDAWAQNRRDEFVITAGGEALRRS